MNIRYSIFFLIFLTSCSSTLPNSVRIVKIVDGDTVHAINKKKETIKIRLAGIDAPETRGKQPFGKAAKRHLIGLLDDNSTSHWLALKKTATAGLFRLSCKMVKTLICK